MTELLLQLGYDEDSLEIKDIIVNALRRIGDQETIPAICDTWIDCYSHIDNTDTDSRICGDWYSYMTDSIYTLEALGAERTRIYLLPKLYRTEPDKQKATVVLAGLMGEHTVLLELENSLKNATESTRDVIRKLK